MRVLSRRARQTLALLVCVASIGLAAVVTASAAAAAGSNPLTITASEYSYKVSGTPKSGWTQVTLKNVGDQFHMVLALPLKAGVTLAQVKQAALSDDAQAALGPLSGQGSTAGIPFLAGPGTSSTTISKIDAGRYALICFFSAPDGKPHIAHGMIKLLDVSKAKSNLTPPSGGVVDVTTGPSPPTGGRRSRPPRPRIRATSRSRDTPRTARRSTRRTATWTNSSRQGTSRPVRHR
jgi:hypothetical protein